MRGRVWVRVRVRVRVRVSRTAHAWLLSSRFACAYVSVGVMGV